MEEEEEEEAEEQVEGGAESVKLQVGQRDGVCYMALDMFGEGEGEEAEQQSSHVQPPLRLRRGPPLRLRRGRQTVLPLHGSA